MSRLLSGRKCALAPGGNCTPWLSRNSLAPSRFTSCRPPVLSCVSLPVPTAGAAAAPGVAGSGDPELANADGPMLTDVLINPGGTRYSLVNKSLLCSLIGMIETA